METEKTIVNERVDTTLKTSDFWYDLPEELIAQTPVEPRDESRLLILDRASGEMRHRVFRDILEELRPEDMLVVNSSKVIPARLLARRIAALEAAARRHVGDAGPPREARARRRRLYLR